MIDSLKCIIDLANRAYQSIRLCFIKKAQKPVFVASLFALATLFTFATFATLPKNKSYAAEIELPLLGDSSSSIISKNQEYTLGKTWLQAFRSRVSQYDDPLLQQYMEQLLYDLVTHSDLNDTRLTLVIVNNPTMNAFALPGGIIGFHTGIFSFAKNEDQMVSILAHELAHLSQRHFARGIESRRNTSVVSLAGLLATLVLTATAGGDAGLAAMTATQAYALEEQLRYSRGNEQEADRLGLKTMIRAGRDPNAVAEMFESLLKASRYNSNRMPEFLLTHPVTERRIADSRARTFRIQERHYPDNPEFYLLQARALLAIQVDPKQSVAYFKQLLASNTQQTEAAEYGLALAYLAQKDFDTARKRLERLSKAQPNSLPFLYSSIEVDIAEQRYKQALTALNRQLALNQNNYPLLTLKAEALWGAHRYDEAAITLNKLRKQRPEDPHIWYKLAEVRGLAGDISGVHEARAEYFILVGALDRARRQLGLAAKLVEADFKRHSVVKQRLRDITKMQERLERL